MKKKLPISAVLLLIVFSFFAGCSDKPTTIATVEVKPVSGSTDKITTYAVGNSATLGQETVTIYEYSDKPKNFQQRK
jgi:uncharacterized lipoprotein YajG